MRSSNDFEEIDDLSYREQHFLDYSIIPSVFVDYRAPKFEVNFLDMVRLKNNTAKPRHNFEELASNIKDNTECEQPSSPAEDGEHNDNAKKVIRVSDS